LNEAAGGVGGGTTAGVMGVMGGTGVTVNGIGATVNVTGPLLPAGFPGIELFWLAIAVYCPLDRAGLALPDVHPAPVPAAVAVETTGPFGVAPAWIWMVTGVVSLAVPVKDGAVL
jgi:hypothetical protein